MKLYNFKFIIHFIATKRVDNKQVKNNFVDNIIKSI